MRKQILLFTALLAVFAVLISAGCVTTDSPGDSEGMVTITDAFGRDVTIPENPEKIAVVGSGSMRYFVYLGIDLDDVCAVDYQDSKLNIQTVNVRPYALANPEILEIPEVGAAKGVVDNEKLLMSGAEILFMGGSFQLEHRGCKRDSGKNRHPGGDVLHRKLCDRQRKDSGHSSDAGRDSE